MSPSGLPVFEHFLKTSLNLSPASSFIQEIGNYDNLIVARTLSKGFGLAGLRCGFLAADPEIIQILRKVSAPYPIPVPVVDIAGDGSFRMTENSLSTSVDEGIPVIVVILNNQMLGMVAQWQRLFFCHRYSAVELRKIPDFVKLTKSYGAEGVRVNSLKEFTSAVKKAMNVTVTTVIDVPIDPEENVLPMVPAGQSLDKIIEG